MQENAPLLHQKTRAGGQLLHFFTILKVARGSYLTIMRDYLSQMTIIYKTSSLLKYSWGEVRVVTQKNTKLQKICMYPLRHKVSPRVFMYTPHLPSEDGEYGGETTIYSIMRHYFTKYTRWEGPFYL